MVKSDQNNDTPQLDIHTLSRMSGYGALLGTVFGGVAAYLTPSVSLEMGVPMVANEIGLLRIAVGSCVGMPVGVAVVASCWAAVNAARVVDRLSQRGLQALPNLFRKTLG